MNGSKPAQLLTSLLSYKLRLLQYVKARLSEKGTWASIGVGVTGAATLVHPWDYVFIAVAVMGVLVPTP